MLLDDVRPTEKRSFSVEKFGALYGNALVGRRTFTLLVCGKM